MFAKVFNWFKPLIAAFILLAFLQVTGLLSSVSYYSQSALLATGLRDASTSALKKTEPFDFNFTIKDLKGERVSFEQYKGKVVFLNVWATWCGPCRVEMPSIQKLYEKMDTTGVAFVILSIDRDSDKAKIDAYVAKYKYTFPVFQPSGELTSQLDLPSIPTTFVINKEGHIVAKEVGTTNFDTAKFRKFLHGLNAQ